MRTLSLTAAVIYTVGDFKKQQANFSAYDATKKIRDEVNAGELVIPNSESGQDANGEPVQLVSHNDVKSVVTALYENGLMPDYRKEYNRDGGYYEYIYDSVKLATPQTVNSNVIPVNFSSSTQKLYPANVATKIGSYVRNKFSKGERPSLKSIQSRLRRDASLTCREIAPIVKTLGYFLLENPYVFSQSLVRDNN